MIYMKTVKKKEWEVQGSCRVEYKAETQKSKWAKQCNGLGEQSVYMDDFNSVALHNCTPSSQTAQY